MKFKWILGTVLWLVLIGGGVAVYNQRIAIYDWARLRDYHPSTQVASLATQDTMTDKGRHLFYINQPQLVSDVSTFRSDCPDSEKSIVLGCYHPIQNGIFVYNISDSRLSGVQQVTAAHEMLHAAYDRLSTKDKNYINGLLSDYYTNDLKDQRVIDIINEYKKTEPNAVVNEMHSVFGTEIQYLPPALNNYYTQYFTNRSAVTQFAHNYENEFTSRTDQITAGDLKLSALKQQITTEENKLDAMLDQLNSNRARLNSLRASSPSAYNAEVAGFNRQVEDYNAQVEKVKVLVTQYNDLVVERNAVADQLKSLTKTIDTRNTTQPTQ